MTQVTDSAYNALKIVLLASLQRSHAATLSELETILDELEVTDPSARDLQQLLASINLDISSYGRSIAPSLSLSSSEFLTHRTRPLLASRVSLLASRSQDSRSSRSGLRTRRMWDT